MRSTSYAPLVTSRFVSIAVLVLLLVGCVPADDGDAGASPTTPETTVAPTANDPVHRLVVGTVGGAVRVVEGDGSPVVELEPQPGDAYRQPVWTSEDTILSSFSSIDDGAGLASIDPTTGEVEWATPMGSPPFYYLPAPTGASDLSTSLRNDPSGAGLIAELVDRSGAVRPLATVSPFYATWSPDGGALGMHGEGRRLAVRTAGGTTTIAEPTGGFQAPVWTSDGLVTIRTVDDDQVLSVWDGAEFRDVAGVAGPVRFTAAAGRVAIQSIAEDTSGGVQAAQRVPSTTELPGGRLLVVDLESGVSETVSSVLTPMFQWDPTGRRLLFATFEAEDELRFTWRVWEDGTVTELAPFVAQPGWFRDVVPFFDQYVQSISLWAPDGSAVAYPEIVDARPVVTIRSLDGSPATRLADATWVSWRLPPG